MRNDTHHHQLMMYPMLISRKEEGATGIRGWVDISSGHIVQSRLIIE